MREDGANRLEVHAAGILLDGGRVLVAKRSPARLLYPNLWECGGGQVEAGEGFEEAVVRQLREELGVLVEPIAVLRMYDIPTTSGGQGKIPGVKFVCRLKGFANGREPAISGEHTEWRWQPISKLSELAFIPGVPEDIERAYGLFRKVGAEV